jgi:hypothetical protein
MCIDPFGKVGIGTTVPYSLLHVRLSADPTSFPTAANTYLGLEGAGTSNGYVTLGFGYAGIATAYRPAAITYKNTQNGGNQAGELGFWTRNDTSGSTVPTQRMVITDDGKVGIGITTGFSAKLHVLDSTFPQVRIEDRTASGEAGIRFRSHTNSGTGLHGDIFVDSTGSETGRMGFRIPWNGTEKLTILHDGNVGIGTVSPGAYKLYVNGSSYVNGDLNVSGDGYVVGDLTIGTGTTYYNLPATRGTVGQVLKTNASGIVTWQADAGGGVTSVATSGAITGGTITTTGTITHSVAAGYVHIPSGGSSGQILGYASAGTASWQTSTIVTSISSLGTLP